ncbi:MAG: GFA family protein [Pseudomonadota bacterium]
MAKSRDHEGGCLCGEIRFIATGPIANPHSCSCRMCQRHSGALTAVWVEFPEDAVRWTGTGGAPATYRSSEMSSRAFCATCGSTLGAIDDAPVIALLLGAFDKPDHVELAPTSHSYRSARPRWWKPEISR